MPSDRIALLLALLLVSPAIARADAASRAQAQGMVEKGLQAFKAGRFADALAQFEAANALEPSPRLYFNIGLAQLRSGAPQDAASNLDRFLTQTASDPSVPAKNLEAARQELRNLAPRWAKLIVHVNPADASVTVDGVALTTAPTYLERSRPHSVHASAPGRHELDKQVQAAASGSVTVELLLVPLPAPPPPAPTLATPEPQAAPPTASSPPAGALVEPTPPVVASPSHLPSWIAFGAAAALAVPTAYFGIHALSLRNDINSRGNQCGDAAMPGYDASCGDWKSKAQTADVFGALAIAAGATGGVLWFVTPGQGGVQAGVGGKF